jgi:GH15 family glucan-1,4-alpha-glucosidase
VSNGFAVGVYDLQQAKLTSFREHVYQVPSPQLPRTRDLAFDAYFGARSSHGSQWLNSLPVDGAEYVNHDGILKVTQHQGPATGGLLLETYVISSFEIEHPSVFLLLHAKNTGTFPLADVSLFSLLNFHTGLEGQESANEQISLVNGQYVERGLSSGRALVYRPFPAASTHACSPNNPFLAVTSGQHLTETNSSGATNDAVAGFEWVIPGGLAGGQEQWVAVSIGDSPSGNDAAVRAAFDEYLSGLSSADQILAKEQAAWAAWREGEVLPEGMRADEAEIARLSTAILRMGQSREAGSVSGPTPFGQIVASIHPGQWDIAWVRDGALAIVALIRSGHPEEAKAGLEFMLRAQSGLFQEFVGTPYQISVTRYFGLGIEESDFNQNGPNIEFDDFGLFLFALGEYVSATGDASLVERFGPQIFELTADVLVGLIEPQTGLLKPDSSIWESHIFNGAAKRYTFSNLAAILGLRAAAELAESRADARAATYRAKADSIQAALSSQLLDPAGLLAGSLEELQSGLSTGEGYYDGAALFGFVFGALEPDGETARATALGMIEYLSCENGRGVHRNDNGDSYDEAEWALIDLWLATTLRRVGEEEASQALLDWVTAQGQANFGIVPELFDPTTGAPAGEAPMVGFGAGMYLLTLQQRAADQATPPPPPPPPPPPVEEVPELIFSGGCATSGVSVAWGWASLALVLAWLSLRRGSRS